MHRQNAGDVLKMYDLAGGVQTGDKEIKKNAQEISWGLEL